MNLGREMREYRLNDEIKSVPPNPAKKQAKGKFARALKSCDALAVLLHVQPEVGSTDASPTSGVSS